MLLEKKKRNEMKSWKIRKSTQRLYRDQISLTHLERSCPEHTPLISFIFFFFFAFSKGLELVFVVVLIRT